VKEEEQKEEKNETKKEPVNQSNIENDLKVIRVGNTLCNPSKSIVENVRKNWNSIKDYSFDEELGNIARLLSSDVMPVAASETNIILISKLNGISVQINNEHVSVEKIMKKSFDKDFKIICI
jgi:hypothetical protein